MTHQTELNSSFFAAFVSFCSDIFPFECGSGLRINPTAGLARRRILGLVISLCAAVEHLRLS